MKLQAAIGNECSHLLQIGERQHLAVVGVLKADQASLDEVGIIRRQRGLDIIESQRAVTLHRQGLQGHGAQHGTPLRFVTIDVSGGSQYGPLTALTVAHHRQQVGHGAGRHKQCRLFAQQSGPVGLQRVDARIFTIDIVTDFGVEHGLTHGISRLGDGVTS